MWSAEPREGADGPRRDRLNLPGAARPSVDRGVMSHGNRAEPCLIRVVRLQLDLRSSREDEVLVCDCVGANQSNLELSRAWGADAPRGAVRTK